MGHDAVKSRSPFAGEMMVGSKTVFFMDEISTGLDSSTTYAIVKFLRDQTHALNYTTMISLLQPAPESFELFDDVLLLAEGILLPAAAHLDLMTTLSLPTT